MNQYLAYALPLIIVAVALVLWLAVHRRYRRNLRRSPASLAREQDLTRLEENSLLTPEERRRIRVAIARKIKETDGGDLPPHRRPAINIRDLEDKPARDDG